MSELREFDVTITETLERVVTVQAESRGAAEAMVRRQYDSSEIVLDSGDFTGVEFFTDEGYGLGEPGGRMNVLLVSPQKYPEQIMIPTTLEALQAAVGGDIEVIYPFEERVALIMNEEGKLLGLPANRGLYAENGDLNDIIAGNFLIVGLDDEDFTSLTPDQMKAFEKAFHQPELFVKMGKSVKAIPMPDDMVKTGADAPDKGNAPRPKAQER